MTQSLRALALIPIVLALHPTGVLAESLGQSLEESEILAVTPNPPARPLDPGVYAEHFGPRGKGYDGSAALNRGCEKNTGFRFAAGIHDVTGAGYDQGMAGYADTAQTSEGLHNRQWARAFIIESSCGGAVRRIALISQDQGLMFHAVKQGLMDLVADDPELAGQYDYGNVMVNVTHSHATAAGQAHHDLYNITAAGHDEQSYAALVAGTFMALKRAHGNLQTAAPGEILFNQGELLNTTIQRSLPAYLQNPEAERQRFVDVDGEPVTINRNSVTLRLRRGETDVAMLNWFPIHGTSMAQTNKLLSGDNKGYAAWRFEQDHDVDYLGDEQPFVAGFFQADEGDNSPNVLIDQLSEAELRDLQSERFQTRGGGANDFESTLISGYKQYAKARDLFASAETVLTGGVGHIAAFIDLTRVAVDESRVRAYPEPLQTAPFNTCEPALGVSFGGGAEDGRGPTEEGQTCAAMDQPTMERWQKLFEDGFAAGGRGSIPPQLVVPVGCNNPAFNALGYACHAEKPILFPLAVSPFDPTQSLSARIDMLQIFTIGNLAVIGLPWEVTTTSGRRIREAVLDELEGAGIDYAVIAGLANNYSHYLTTREEYSVQQYEGASTLFGPWTQEAVQAELVGLARDLLAGQPPTSANAVAAYRTHLTSFVHRPNTSDGMNPAPAFGAVVQEPEACYPARGEALVEAVFVAGNPRNDLRQQDSYLFIERETGNGKWKVRHTDNDWSTRYRFEPEQDDGTSHGRVTWVVPPGTPPGTYRVRHTGGSASGPYEGVSRTFDIGRCG